MIPSILKSVPIAKPRASSGLCDGLKPFAVEPSAVCPADTSSLTDHACPKDIQRVGALLAAPSYSEGIDSVAQKSGWRGTRFRAAWCCAALFGLAALLLIASAPVHATPANKLALVKYFGKFLPRRFDSCATCHQSAKPDKPVINLTEFPHNPFGHRLALAANELRKQGKKADIPARILFIAKEDSDGDGVDNLTELLLGHAPGDPNDKPTAKEVATAPQRRAEFAKFLASYRWQPFDTVRRPAVPKVKNAAWVRNPIDAFLAAEHEARGLKPRPPASNPILLRRVTLDLTGLEPTPDELRAFETDKSPNAYENVVDRLLASPRYGERWGRHWMDVWRYSDWAGWADGGQIRDSKPFIWRWRDWIVESLNKDKGYDRMAMEMLAADELCPEDTDALRATGFLVRNFKLLSREQWMEDTVNHTTKAFLGVTMHCAKCHNHMYDPFSQQEYYRFRAIFEPHNVRTDRIPGQPDTAKDGLVRAYDADPKTATYFFPRGDDRHPDKNQPMTPGIPEALGGSLNIQPVKFSLTAYAPDKREFVLKETVEAGEKALADARKALEAVKADAKATPDKQAEAALNVSLAEARQAALLALLRTERLEDADKKNSAEWKQAATETAAAQRKVAAQEAELNLLLAKRALALGQANPGPMVTNGKRVVDKAALERAVAEAEKALTAANAELKAAPTTAYKPRALTTYPAESTGRRLAFARWLTDRRNPLTARVAMNHIWMRHFGEGIVPSTSDFGRNGRPPSHPQLLDWLAAEFMSPTLREQGKTVGVKGRRGEGVDPIQNPDTRHPTPDTPLAAWSMKRMHRLIVTSNAYRMASTPDTKDAKIDPDNIYLWRMSSRRMEAEVVRDNILYTSGQLDETMGGPDIDHNLGLTSKRRSIYLRIAAEKEAEFLKIFDSPSVTECYERKPSVMPQQALALANSTLAVEKAHLLADALNTKVGKDNAKFTTEAFLRVLTRRPTPQELKLCLAFLTEHSRQREQGKTEGVKGRRGEGENPTTQLPNYPITQLPNTQSAEPTLRARENLVLVLFNHNDFVTIR